MAGAVGLVDAGGNRLGVGDVAGHGVQAGALGAHADTPNYKARDLDFAAVLAEQKDKAAKGTFATRTTNERHIAAEGFGMGEGSLQYRIPVQPSIDQNTVDAQIEQANYAENAMHFQSSFTFLNSKFKGLVSALRGE